MSLNHFIQPKKKVPLKAALRRMRGMWLSGPCDHFDKKLARVLDCSLSHAARIREEWENLGFLLYDKRGLLCWRSGGF